MEGTSNYYDSDKNGHTLTMAELWEALNKHRGNSMIVKIIDPNTKDDDYPAGFSLEGLLEIGEAQARVLNSQDNYVYFRPENVDGFVLQRISDNKAVIQLRF